MTGVVTVETSSRWETSSLMRKLRGHSPYAVQVGQAHWLVRGFVGESPASVAEIEKLLSEWAAEEGTRPPILHFDSVSRLRRFQ